MRSAVALLLALSGAHASFPPRELEPTIDLEYWSTAHVASWVRSIGYAEYASVFTEAKVNGLRLLGLSAETLQSELLFASAEHALVIEMEISSLRHRRGLMSAAEARQFSKLHPSPDGWGVAEVSAFLEELGLGAYAKRFAKQRVDGPTLLQLPEAGFASLLDASPNKYEANQASLEVLLAGIKLLKRRLQHAQARHDEL